MSKQTRSNAHIREAFDLARKLTILADKGEGDSMDNGCVLLFGVVRDSAYHIRKQAEREKEEHIRKGLWPPMEED